MILLMEPDDKAAENNLACPEAATGSAFRVEWHFSHQTRQPDVSDTYEYFGHRVYE
jgi:hypothetical protein